MSAGGSTDLLKAHPEQVPWRPAVGIQPRVTDAEIITLAVMQALLSFTSEARFLRYANKHLRQMFPVLPGQSGYNKRLRKLTHTMAWLIGVLTTQVSVVTDQVWLVDSTRSSAADPALRRRRIVRAARPRTHPPRPGSSPAASSDVPEGIPDRGPLGSFTPPGRRAWRRAGRSPSRASPSPGCGRAPRTRTRP